MKRSQGRNLRQDLRQRPRGDSACSELGPCTSIIIRKIPDRHASSQFNVGGLFFIEGLHI